MTSTRRSLQTLEAGFLISDSKLVNATKKLELLGLEIDASNQTVRLTVKRQTELAELLASVLRQKTISLRDFRSLTGKQSFAIRAVRQGRTFLRSFYALAHSATEVNPSKHLNRTRTLKVICDGDCIN